MARRFTKLIFDDFLFSTRDYFPPSSDAALLASASRMALFAVADQVGGPDTLLVIEAEHSADGRTWRSVAGTFQIRADLSAGETVSSGSLSEELLRLVRVRVSLLGTAPSAHVKIYATGRDRA